MSGIGSDGVFFFLMRGRRPGSTASRASAASDVYKRQGLESTPEDMARATGRDPYRVESQMNKLVHLHILEEREGKERSRYRYVPPHSVATYLLSRNRR